MSDIDDILKKYENDKPEDIKLETDNNINDIISKYSEGDSVAKEVPVITSLKKEEPGFFDIATDPRILIDKMRETSSRIQANTHPEDNPFEKNEVTKAIRNFNPITVTAPYMITKTADKVLGGEDGTYKDYLRAVTGGIGGGADESMISKAVDPSYDPKRQQYKLHLDSWGEKVLTDRQSRINVLKDLSHITGKLLYDIPAIMAIGETTGGLGLPNAVSSFATMGAMGASENALDQNRMTGKVDPMQAAKAGGISGVAGVAGNVAGKIAEGVSNTIGTGISGFTNQGSIPNVIAQKTVPLVTSLNKNTADVLTQSYLPAKMEGRKMTKEDLIMGGVGTIMTNAGMTGIAHGKEATAPDKPIQQTEGLLEKVKGADIPHVTTQENAHQTIQAINKYRESGGEETYMAHNLARDAVKEVHDAQTVSSFAGKTTEAHKFLNDARNIEEVLTLKVREIEHQTGQKSYMLDERGVIRPEYVMSKDQIQSWMHDYEKGTGRFKDRDITMDDWLDYSVVESLNKAYKDVSKEGTYSKIKETAGIDPKQNVKVYSSLAKDARREMTANKIVDNDTYYSPEHKNSLKRFHNTSAEQTSKIIKGANYSKLSKLESLGQFFTNTPLFYHKKLGEVAARHIIEPIRITNMKLTRDMDAMYDRVSNAVKDLNTAELRQVVISRIAKQVNARGENTGMRTISDMLERKHITQDEVKSYDQLSDKQKELYEFMTKEFKESLARENEIQKALGKKETKGLGDDYMPMKSRFDWLAMDGNHTEVTDKTKNPAFVEKMVRGAGYLVGHKRLGGIVDVSLDPAEILMAHLEKSLRKTNTALVADKLNLFADDLMKSGREDIGNHLKKSVAYWSGNYVDPSMARWARGVVNMMNNNINSSVLAWSVGTMMSNSLTFNNVASIFGSERTYKAYNEICRRKVQGEPTPADISPTVFARLTTTRSKKASMAHSSNTFSRGKAAVTKGGLSTMEFVDHLNAEVAYLTAFDYYFKEQGLSKAEAEYKAGEFTNLSQGSGDRIDLAPVHRGALGKLFLSFTTFPLSNLNFLISKAYGLNPGLAHRGTFDTEEEAKAYAKENGLEYKQVGKDHNVYDNITEANYADRIKRALYFTMFNTAVGILMQKQEEFTNIPLNVGGANPISGAVKGITGHSLEDYGKKVVFGDRLSRDRRHAGRKVLDTALNTTVEMASDIPMAGQYLKNGRLEGSTIGAFNRIGLDFSRFHKNPTWRKAINMGNDISIVFGAPTYRGVNYVLKYTGENRKK